MIRILIGGLALALSGIVLGTISGQPEMRLVRSRALVVLAGCGLAYGLALIMVAVSPIWVTDGVEVWADFPEHLLWAAVGTARSQFVGVPSALAG